MSPYDTPIKYRVLSNNNCGTSTFQGASVSLQASNKGLKLAIHWPPLLATLARSIRMLVYSVLKIIKKIRLSNSLQKKKNPHWLVLEAFLGFSRGGLVNVREHSRPKSVDLLTNYFTISLILKGSKSTSLTQRSRFSFSQEVHRFVRHSPFNEQLKVTVIEEKKKEAC